MEVVEVAELGEAEAEAEVEVVVRNVRGDEAGCGAEGMRGGNAL